MVECNKKYKKKTLVKSFMSGGIGYGTLCIPGTFADLLIIIVFPPLFVILNQIKKGYFNFKEIIVNILLTSLFYFPGFLHALNILKTKKKH